MGPLSGLSVCDVTQNLAGPFCAQILGDLGADVIKVEPPGGDSARAWGPPFWGSDSTLFLSANRNKRSIVVDLKREEGREVLRRLAARSDIFLESARPGVPERLGYDYASVRRIREDVIYLSITAFGDRGPRSDDPGYEPLIQAYAGIMSLTGYPDGPPARVGGSVVDFGTAMWSVIAILSALRTRDATGQGARLDTALLDTAFGWVSYHVLGYLATGHTPERMGSGLASIAPYRAFETTDGYVMIAGGSDPIFRRLCDALDLGTLHDDARFATNPARVRNEEALAEELEPRLGALSTERAVELLRRHSVPCSPIQDIAQVAADPQIHEAELLPSALHGEVDDYRDVAAAFRLNGTRPRGDRPPPRAGEHTSEILGDLGFSDSDVEGLRSGGAVECLDTTMQTGGRP